MTRRRGPVARVLQTAPRMQNQIQTKPASREGQILGGKWRLDSLLGVGGMGEVYAATHRNGSRVAIKVLLPHLANNDSFRARFLREGYAANAVEHPGVVRILDDDMTEDGLPFLVMELLEGKPLDEHVLDRGGRLPLAETLAMGDALLQVLATAHQRQILHRDIKPENVFRLHSGEVKVLDFGLARLQMDNSSSKNGTQEGRAMGTPGYMPPEQACGDWGRVNVTSDLWALSAVLHFCLTGKAIHDVGEPQRTLQLVASTPAPSIRELAPSLPDEIIQFIDHGLAFEHEHRWQSAAEMMSALRQLRDRFSPREGDSKRLRVDVTPPEVLSPVEIAPGTYWVGKRDPHSIFHANPYLRIFDDAADPSRRFAVLIDPGSASDFSVVMSKVNAVLGAKAQLSALFINHQDPDVGSSATVICARFAPRAKLICSEATWRLILHLGLPRDRFIDTEKYPHGFRIPTGQVVLPVPSPFCHFRGAVMLYDPATRVLFSGDLFGGLTAEGAQGLWADESDWSGLRAFHQTYMPCNRAIAPVLRRIRELDPPVEIIAPQHGRLLRGPILRSFLDRLSTLPVGLDLLEEEQSPDLLVAWNSVLHRVVSVATSLLGPGAIDILRESDALHGVLFEEDGRLSVSSMGRWAVSMAVNELTTGQPATVSNPIKIEAMIAAEQFELPSPDLHIDDSEGTESFG